MRLLASKPWPATPALHRRRRLARPRTSPFHGGNAGSNPAGDANILKDFCNSTVAGHGPIWSTWPCEAGLFRTILTSLLCASRFCGLTAVPAPVPKLLDLLVD